MFSGCSETRILGLSTAMKVETLKALSFKNLLLIKPSRAVLLIAPLLLSLQSHASSLGFSVGMHGLAVEYTHTLSPSFDVRFGLSDMPIDEELKADGIEYDLTYDRTNISALVDFKPWQGSFHLTIGLFALEHDWNIKSDLNGEYHIGDGYYRTENVTLKGDLGFATASPYFGFGWKNITGSKNAWSMNVDLGVLYIGSATVEYGATGMAAKCSATCAGATLVDVELSADFQQNLAEEEDELKEKLEDFEFLPIVQLGVNYAF